MFSDPYRTVLLSITGILLLTVGLLIYKYIYPKKEISLFKILILVSILPLLSLLRPGDYESGDFNVHIYRIMAFYDSLREGNLIPSWAGELNATYGNPLFIFNYSLPYYLVSFFHFLGFSFILSMKIYLGLSLFFSGIFMYLFIKDLTNNRLAAFSSGIFYIFNPYHLIDVHFRATLGESTIFTLAPLTFYFLIKYFNSKQIIHLILLGIFTAILFQAHPLMALTIVGIMFLYSVFYCLRKGKRKFMNILAMLILGCLSSIYLWSSFIIYAPYIYPYPSSELYFYPFHQLFYSPWKLGFLFQGHYGELALIIGYTQLLIIFISIIALFRKKIKPIFKKDFIFWLVLFFIFLFLMHPGSFFIWKLFPLFWMFPPTGRLLLPIAFTTSVLAGFFILNFYNAKTKRIIYALLIITVLYTILNWGHRTVISTITDANLRDYVWESTKDEGRVAYFLNNKWADHDNFWFSELPKSHLEILQGQADIEEISRNSTRHIYIIDAKTPLIIKENTLFYPGWELRSNGKKVNIYPGERGVINAKLPRGLQKIELKYSDISIYKQFKYLSIGVFAALFLFLFRAFVKRK